MNSNKPLDLKINAQLVNFLLAAMVAFPVVAVSETEKKVRTLEEITVIARRVEERLEDVPASVSVLTEDALRRSGVASVEGVVNLTPGAGRTLGVEFGYQF